MLKITPHGEHGNTINQFTYVPDKNFVSPIILPVTRWLRAINANKYIGDCERLLDIGCGDGYFLRRRKECKERYGLDILLGDTVTDTLDFPNNYFDYVTMLAVIEHLSDPEKLVDEICRVLKPNGKLIITTPKKKAEFIIGLYAPDVKNMHESYFDLSRIKDIAGNNYKLIGDNTFIFSLNQVFCLQKINSCNIETNGKSVLDGVIKMDEKEKIECDNYGKQFIRATENTTCPNCKHEGHYEDEGYQDAEMD